MAQQSELVTVREVTADISEIRLTDLAAKNALSAKLVSDLRAALADARCEGRRGVILTSAADAFSAGFHLKGLRNETDASLLARFTEIGLLLEEIDKAPFFTCAVVEGAAIGAGADVALACDARVATDRAMFRFPGANFGIILGTDRLAQLVGNARASALTQFGETMSYAESLQHGVVRACTQEQDALSSAVALTESVCRLPGATASGLRRAMGRDRLDTRLADLVRSASIPGLAERIASFAAIQLVDRSELEKGTNNEP